MSLMKRISLIFRSKANKALDKAEDPRETLDYSYQRQLELLSKVRRGVADVATSRKRVELQVNQLEQQAAKLQGQAEKAISVGREDLAREALTRKSGLASQITSLKEQQATLQGEEEKLVLAQQRLQAKVQAFRTKLNVSFKYEDEAARKKKPFPDRAAYKAQLDAATAAFEVGYESASQFNREYSRYFIGIDGISLPLLVLSMFVTVLVVIYTPALEVLLIAASTHPGEERRVLDAFGARHQPGDRLTYSNATDVLGIMLERIEGTWLTKAPSDAIALRVLA